MNIFARMFSDPPRSVIDQMTLDYSTNSAFRRLVAATEVEAFTISPAGQYMLFEKGNAEGRLAVGRLDAIHHLLHAAPHTRPRDEVKELAEAAKNDLHRTIGGTAGWRERLQAHVMLAEQYPWHDHEESKGRHL